MLPDTSSMTMRRIGCGVLSNCGDRLRLALVAHLEVVAAERGDEAAVAIGHGAKTRTASLAAAKHRLLRAGAAPRTSTRPRRAPHGTDSWLGYFLLSYGNRCTPVRFPGRRPFRSNTESIGYDAPRRTSRDPHPHSRAGCAGRIGRDGPARRKTDCNRACLIGFADTYLKALARRTRRTPSRWRPTRR